MNTHVNFPLAKILKEKGFDKPCNSSYEHSLTSQIDPETNDYTGSFGWKEGETNINNGFFVNNEPNIDFSNNNWYMCAAPTIAGVVMWIYEKYGIWIQSPFSHNDRKPFCWVITKTFRNISEKEENRNCWLSGIDNDNTDGYDLPTEAYQEAIKYVLTNLI